VKIWEEVELSHLLMEDNQTFFNSSRNKAVSHFILMTINSLFTQLQMLIIPLMPSRYILKLEVNIQASEEGVEEMDQSPFHIKTMFRVVWLDSQ
jgi:hypothetical protein